MRGARRVVVKEGDTLLDISDRSGTPPTSIHIYDEGVVVTWPGGGWVLYPWWTVLLVEGGGD